MRIKFNYFILLKNGNLNNEELINIDTLSIVSFNKYKLNLENNNEKFINIFLIYSFHTEKKFNNEINLEEKNENAILLERDN